MKNGIIFQSAENEKKDIGPGYYSVEKDYLNKPTFNVRASKGKQLPPSPANSRPRTPTNVMRRAPSTDEFSRHQVFGDSY
jgi:hypothetical protein